MRALVVVTMWLAAFPAAATMLTSAITGRVTTANAPAAGVTVTATSNVLLSPRTTTTSARGTYWLGALPPGQYDITFSRAGLTTLTRRAIVELARVARADAALVPASEEGDSVTSTAKTISVADTTSITTHFSDAMLDRMPVGRDPVSAASIGPASLVPFTTMNLDDAPFADFIGEEAIEQVTLIRGGVPATYDDDHGKVLAAITHTGGEDFTLTLRDTITNHGHRFESASGGRIVRDRLWFFAAGWSGLHTDGYVIKLSAQPAPAHHLVAETIDGASLLALRYTATPSDRTTLEALFDRSHHDDLASARASLRIGEHLVSAGGTTDDDRDAFYASDRWSSFRWTLDAGLRYEHNELLPRIAMTFDPRGDGSRAVVATYSEFASIHVASLGYAAAIGSSGSARIDLVHREESFVTTNEAQVDARYRLFDRFEAGANYAHHIAAGWISAELPLGGNELGATLLQRYSGEHWPLDLAVRYTIPFPHFALTFAGDLVNVFGAEPTATIEPRTFRAWMRARL